MTNKHIDTETDLDILTDLANGISRKDIAERYSVSASYISKLINGKKKFNVHVIRDTSKIDEILPIVSDEYIRNYLLGKIREAEHKICIYKKILNELKENENE